MIEQPSILEFVPAVPTTDNDVLDIPTTVDITSPSNSVIDVTSPDCNIRRSADLDEESRSAGTLSLVQASSDVEACTSGCDKSSSVVGAQEAVSDCSSQIFLLIGLMLHAK